MALAYEHRLARSAVRNRRGVWTTFGGGGSWESILFQTPEQDPLDVLGMLKDISSVQRDVTQEVFRGEFIEPDGGWMLVVHSKYQDWVWLVGTHELLGSLMQDSPGRWLRTGDQNTSGAIYVEVRENGKRTLFFSSDGVAWDDDEDDSNGFLEFESEEYDKDWPHEYQTIDDVHQQLIIDQDAYVPLCIWNEGLHAMQNDAVQPRHVARIDLVTFGGQRKTLSPSQEKQARRLREELKNAIWKRDLKRVESVFAKNPDLTRIPKNSMTALGFAAYCVNYDPNSLAIVKRLLDAGADPNDGGVEQPTPLAHLVDWKTMIPLDRFEMMKTLKNAGADVNRPSQFRWGFLSEDKYPLLKYTFEQQMLAPSLWLLNHGATGVDEEQIRYSLKFLSGLKLKEIRKHPEIRPPRGLVKGLERLQAGEFDKPPTLNFATRLATWETDLEISTLPEGSVMRELATQSRDKASPKSSPSKPRKKKEKSKPHFAPDRKSVEALPEIITLKPVKRLFWKDNIQHQKFRDSLVEHKFEPIGLFKDETQNHQLEAFLHEKHRIYGIIEQIGETVFGYTAFRYAKYRGMRDHFVVSLDFDVLKSDPIDRFDMEHCILSPIDSIVTQLFDYEDPMDSNKVPLRPNADRFAEDYANAYKLFREKLLKTFK